MKEELKYMKGCTLCDEGMADRLMGLVDDGYSVRGASEFVADEVEHSVGVSMFSAQSIRDRFNRITGNKKEKTYKKKEDIYKEYLYRMSSKYNLSEDEYVDLVNKQRGMCAICSASLIDPDSSNTTHLHVDHDHKTGKTRGILCRGCNLMLGFARDNTDFLYNAICYLQSYEEEEVSVCNY